MDKTERALQHHPNAAEIINMFQPVFDTLKELKGRDDTIIRVVESKLKFEVEQLSRQANRDYLQLDGEMMERQHKLEDRLAQLEALLGQR